jgi:NADPH-dependent glutamate synthase beta subunit-like oxidoreductase
LNLAKEGRYAEALELIKNKNPFPAVCGRVCNKRCEDACTRGTIGEKKPVSSMKSKSSSLSSTLDEDTRVKPRIQHPEYHDHKMAVIGAWPGWLKLRLLSR